MTRYYFDLHECGRGAVTDHDGLEFADLAAAREHAIADARSIMTNEARFGQLCLGCDIAVREESGITVLTMSFADVLSNTSIEQDNAALDEAIAGIAQVEFGRSFQQKRFN